MNFVFSVIYPREISGETLIYNPLKKVNLRSAVNVVFRSFHNSEQGDFEQALLLYVIDLVILSNPSDFSPK